MGSQKIFWVPPITNTVLFAYIFFIRKCRLNKTNLTKYLGLQVILALLYMPVFLPYFCLFLCSSTNIPLRGAQRKSLPLSENEYFCTKYYFSQQTVEIRAYYIQRSKDYVRPWILCEFFLIQSIFANEKYICRQYSICNQNHSTKFLRPHCPTLVKIK